MQGHYPPSVFCAFCAFLWLIFLDKLCGLFLLWLLAFLSPEAHLKHSKFNDHDLGKHKTPPGPPLSSRVVDGENCG